MTIICHQLVTGRPAQCPAPNRQAASLCGEIGISQSQKRSLLGIIISLSSLAPWLSQDQSPSAIAQAATLKRPPDPESCQEPGAEIAGGRGDPFPTALWRKKTIVPIRPVVPDDACKRHQHTQAATNARPHIGSTSLAAPNTTSVPSTTSAKIGYPRCDISCLHLPVAQLWQLPSSQEKQRNHLGGQIQKLSEI